VREERTAEHLTHHQDMLEDVSVLACVGMPLGRLDQVVFQTRIGVSGLPLASWSKWLEQSSRARNGRPQPSKEELRPRDSGEVNMRSNLTGAYGARQDPHGECG
jgi:hypothetical protein